MSTVLKQKIISGLFWQGLEKFGVQLTRFVSSIIIARLLLPEQFGIIALVMVFITVTGLVFEGGIGFALIQRKTVSADDLSTAFWFCFATGILCYIFCFLCAPLVAYYYNQPTLTPIIRVLAVDLLLLNLCVVHAAQLSREMQFKKQFRISLSAVIVSSIVTIAMAYYDYGVWALVGQQVSMSLCRSILLWLEIRWLPGFRFKLQSLKEMFFFSCKLILSSLIGNISENLSSLVIGRVFTMQALGYYNRGDAYPKLLSITINSTFTRVMLPAFSQIQDNREQMRSLCKRTITLSMFLIIPAMLGLTATAPSFVLLLLTEKWLPCVIFMQIACLTYMFQPISIINQQVTVAMGRSDLLLYSEIVKKGLLVTSILISWRWGIVAMSWVICGNYLFGALVNAWISGRLIDYGCLKQIIDLFRILIAAILMFIGIYALNFLGLSSWLLLFLQVAGGILLYTGLSFLLKVGSLQYIIAMLAELLRLRRQAS